MTFQPSARAQVIAARTYSRPINEEAGIFETWEQTVDRVILHQRWLWEVALGDKPLNSNQHAELAKLRVLMIDRKATTSGRTLWLGGTDISKRRQSSMFNCSFGRVETVHDVVDVFWLLLQGCGCGFEPVPGNLNGFTKPVEIEVIRSDRHNLVVQKGRETNREETVNDTWHLTIGDSAEAWAKSVGKLLAIKAPVSKVILDFSQIRPAGGRLKGYGWISSGDETFSKAMEAIASILSRRAGQLLDRIDILDIVNWLGTTLSSRRSAEIALVNYGDPQWREFATAKKDHWSNGNEQRAQSNNSLLFHQKPSRHDLHDIFELMMESGGSEPGFINTQAALERAPWFKGVNPCGEITLPNKGFCNLVEIDLAKFNGGYGGYTGLMEAINVIARANYRQTCVNLVDGVLQRAWHENNDFLRLCGVGVTGIVGWEHQNRPQYWQALRDAAQRGAHSMADELKMPRSKAVTTVKPSGTLSKIMDTTEGLHRPLGEFIFNNVRFSRHDPLLVGLEAAGYHLFDDPYSSDAVLVRFPVSWENVEFDRDADGKKVNHETAIHQLERYKMVMDNYVDHNASVTISYSPEEAPQIVDWIHTNWDHYVGVSFLYRNDPSKTAADLGYPYLPQEVVTEEVFREYAAKVRPVNLTGDRKTKPLDTAEAAKDLEVDAGEECATGACPVR